MKTTAVTAALTMACLLAAPEAGAQSGALTFQAFTDLGNVHVLGSMSGGLVRADNTGTTPVTVTAAALSGDPEFALTFQPALPRVLQPGQVITWSFGFVPQLVTGRRTAAFSVTSSAGGAPHAFTLTADVVDTPLGPWDWQFAGRPVATREIQGIAVDPDDDNVWYVTSQAGLFITRDGGGAWEQPLPGIIGGKAFAIDPTDHNRLYAGFARVCQSGLCFPALYTSTDKGLSWTFLRRFETFGNGALSSLAVDAGDGTLYVPYNIDPAGNYHNPGIYISRDSGSTWEFHPFGVVEDQIIAWDVEQDPSTGVLYVVTEIGDHPQPYNPPVFRSLDRGLTWQEISGTLPWHGVEVHVDRVSHDVYVLTEGPGLYRSSDQGLTWQYLTAAFSLSLSLDERRQGRSYGGAQLGGSGGILRGGAFGSADGGTTFERIGLSDLAVTALALNASATKLYVASYGAGVFVAPVEEFRRPAAFNKTRPADGAAGQTGTQVLWWDASPRATSYEYCIDAIDNDKCDASWLSVGPVTSVALMSLPPGRVFFWQARARNDDGSTDALGGWWSFARGAPFTDDLLTTSVTAIRAVHLIELRTRIDAIRTRFGLPPFAWTDAALAGALIKAVHVAELRAVLGAIYALAGTAAPVYTDATLGPGLLVKAVHVTELRAAVVALE